MRPVTLWGVYHANGGLLGELAYVVGKLRGTAHCGLCDITHGSVRVKPEWKALEATFDVPFKLVHLNEQPSGLAELTHGCTPCVVGESEEGWSHQSDWLPPEGTMLMIGAPLSMGASLDRRCISAAGRISSSIGGTMSRNRFILGAALLLTIGLAPVKALSQNTALIPAPFRTERHDEFMERARQGDIDCLLMGDSITDWWARAGQAVYEENFGPLSCANFGIAADRTQGVLWRFANGELDGYTPKLMMLMIGTNNLRFMGPPNTPEEISLAITAIVTTFRVKFPEAKVLLLGIFPRGAEAGSDLREPIKEINSIIANLDDGEYVRFMDIGDDFLESDGSISVEVMADGLHPTEYGYEIWADAVMPTFREMLGASR